MQRRYLALVLLLAVAAWLVPAAARADSRLATLTVKGMVCQA
jgi:hypothetical protein